MPSIPRGLSAALRLDGAGLEPGRVRPPRRGRWTFEVLKELWENESLGFDPVIVKALISVLGVYPVGALVILDTYELAVVVQANPETVHIHRPLVKIICGPEGTWVSDPPLVDLTESMQDSGYRRSIIKVADPERYGVHIANYLG